MKPFLGNTVCPADDRAAIAGAAAAWFRKGAGTALAGLQWRNEGDADDSI